ncbi:MAG: PTS sugar transporter subunit IIA [Rhodospirillales bacterium]|nr:PTS sugar transporter subunit IIA [Rhodospirillales bacterium]
MIGIVIVSHGRLALELRAAAEQILGFQPNIGAVCFSPDDDVDAKRRELVARVQSADQGYGVLVLTDLFGGTPSNLAISIMGEARVEVIAGVNLPMLVKLATEMDAADSLAAAAASAEHAGRKAIRVASEFLNKPLHEPSKTEKARSS